MSADTSEFDSIGKELLQIPAKMIPKLEAVVARSALNTKKIMQTDVRKSEHFRGKKRPGLDASIDYTIEKHEFGGDAVIEAEIGPNPERNPGAALAGIAYYGSSRPGGGTVRDPEEAMLEEAPNFYEYAFKATEGLL
ncbi:hypothetical protein SAMN04487912_102352 [Arthrobacter sp. cf158]|uniref:hypothetical protein n=1 Tax=Arthrobacter sp. cf158 TaxID=1761744 RepID=UPI000894FCA7|nr:hypothetical protein [Arthrobacter sp. cf158]SDW33036.1 hypothetical protein SAMN04487912_102352 [Arthrobacter sp. cf158]